VIDVFIRPGLRRRMCSSAPESLAQRITCSSKGRAMSALEKDPP
jgi:hypothetical protein